MKLQPFDLQDIRLLDGPFKKAMDTNKHYLMSLEDDRLLFNFRTTAGLPAPGTTYGGWEDTSCTLRGHTMGHVLTACAKSYAMSGDKSYKVKGDHIVAELAKCQKAMGGKYLAAYPEIYWDKLESLTDVPWAPYYVVHKMIQGFVDMYNFTGNKQALEVACNMADYFKARIDKLPDTLWDKILDVEYGGVSDGMLNLYEATKNPKYLALAHKFDKARFLGPLALEHDNLTGLHGNSHIPLVIGAARRYEVTGDTRYRTASLYFWDRIAEHRSYVTGGSTDGEVWPEPDKLAARRSLTNHETCKTYNMLKLTQHLFCWTADPKYPEFYERAFFNGILGTQQPETGLLEYYVPMLTGAHRNYCTPDKSFWCCTGTGLENWSKSADNVYFHNADTLVVNLFLASTVKWNSKGVALEQITRFPEEQGTTLRVTVVEPTAFTLKVRIPSWAGRNWKVMVNGEGVPAKKTNGYVALKRVWHDRDTVKVSLPMSLHTWPMPDDPDLRAVMYGPIVLAGLVGGSVPANEINVVDQFQSAPELHYETTILCDSSKPESWLKAVEGKPMHFTAEIGGKSVEFAPFYTFGTERYGIYWTMLKPDSPRHKAMLEAQAALEAREHRVVDEVKIGDAASEKAHAFVSDKSNSGLHLNRTWRDADVDGFISYTLALPSDGHAVLLTNYWGGESIKREFEILVDGAVLTTVSLYQNKPGEFIDMETPIPAEMVAGKSKVTVTFKGKPGRMAGGVFRCAILLAK